MLKVEIERCDSQSQPLTLRNKINLNFSPLDSEYSPRCYNDPWKWGYSYKQPMNSGSSSKHANLLPDSIFSWQ